MAKDQSAFRELLNRYQRGECTPEEKLRLEAWYNHLGTEQPFNLTPTEKEVLVSTVWQRITDQTTAIPPVLHRRAPSLWGSWPSSVRWAAAAALLLSVGIAG